MICLCFKTVNDWVRRVESIGGSKLSGWDRVRLGQNPVPTPYGSGCAWISRAETRHFFDELVFSDGADRAQRRSWSRSTIDSRAVSRTLAGRRHAASCQCIALTSPTRSLHARAHEKKICAYVRTGKKSLTRGRIVTEKNSLQSGQWLLSVEWTWNAG